MFADNIGSLIEAPRIPLRLAVASAAPGDPIP
jgi:hypothetical protein